MRSFVAHCPELLTEDVIRRLMTPIECAMTMMSQYVALQEHKSSQLDTYIYLP